MKTKSLGEGLRTLKFISSNKVGESIVPFLNLAKEETSRINQCFSNETQKQSILIRRPRKQLVPTHIPQGRNQKLFLI